MKNVSKWVLIVLQNLCKNFIFLPSNPQKKIVREQNDWNKSCRQYYVIGDNFFILTKSQNCGLQNQKCLAEYCLKSFFDQNGLFAFEHYYNFLMHMKTHFSTISFYLNLQINNFFKTARLMNIASKIGKFQQNINLSIFSDVGNFDAMNIYFCQTVLLELQDLSR